jgi:hypothetical protein
MDITPFFYILLYIEKRSRSSSKGVKNVDKPKKREKTGQNTCGKKRLFRGTVMHIFPNQNRRTKKGVFLSTLIHRNPGSFHNFSLIDSTI